MKTEEGALKDKIKRYLTQLGAYWYMPVPHGYGKQTVDFLCCVPYRTKDGLGTSRFVAIETKEKDKKPTPRQEQCLKEVIAAGGVAFWCDNYEGFLLTMASYGLAPVRTE